MADRANGGNVGVDAACLIPWVGAIPDLFFRSNSRNLKIIKRHLDKHHAGTATIEAKALPIDPDRGIGTEPLRRALERHQRRVRGPVSSETTA